MPLEKMVSEALVFDDENFTHTPKAISSLPHLNRRYGEVSQKPVKGLSIIVWCALPDFAAGFRRMMDAPGQHFLQAAGENEMPERCGWWMRADYLKNSVRRLGGFSSPAG